MRYQLHVTNGYGESSTVGSITEDIDKLFETAKSSLYEDNVNNALTLDAKNKSWESFMPVFIRDECDGNGNYIIDTDMLYGGKQSGGRHVVYVLNEKGTGYDMVLLNDVEKEYKLFLGKLDRANWFASDERGQEIHNIVNRSTEAKSIYFVKIFD